jgi:hypothetical protein
LDCFRPGQLRIAGRAGDLRSDRLGEGYDLVFVSAICHMLSPGENLGLLRRCREALAPGGSSYREPEYAAWLGEAGFREIRHARLPEITGFMIGARP